MNNKAVSAAVFFLFLCHGACAETKDLPAHDLNNSLVSKEGQKNALAEPKKKEPKKAVFQLPELDEADEKAEGKIESVEGKISGRNNYGLAVEYGLDKDNGVLEMWATYNNKTKLGGNIKKFADLQEGDRVELKYKKLKKTGKNVLQSVTLLQRKPKEPDLLQ